MAKAQTALSIALFFSALSVASPVRAADVFVIGDSIGEGIALTNKLPGIARRSVGLRRPLILEQMRRVPKGAVVLMSLGLNDAADSIAALSPAIERIIAAATATGSPFVWIGPPCVANTWDVRAKDLDAHLRQRLAGSAVKYVSLRDDDICRPEMRAPDGQHLTPSGYRHVWQKVQSEILMREGLPDAVAVTVNGIEAELPKLELIRSPSTPVATGRQRRPGKDRLQPSTDMKRRELASDDVGSRSQP